MTLDIKVFKDNIKSAKDKSRAWRKEAKECYDFVAGRQWTEEEEAILKEQLRPIVSFNRIAKIIDSVSGHQIVNRQEVKYYQREQGDAQLAEILTAAGEWVDDECEANDEVSDAFMDMIIGGMGSLGGTIVGALITGLIYSFATAYIPEFSLFILFLPVAVILSIRPHGLFGTKA